ncbi:MAG: M56 family metallopeptidase [Acidimicrobiales bacterium]
MILAGSLLAYAALLAVAAPAVLGSGSWSARAPRLGIAVWQALSVSAVLSTVLAGLALAATAAPFGTGLAALLRSCLMALRHGYATPSGVGIPLAGLVLAGAVSARSLACIYAGLSRAARDRRRHAEILAVVGRRGKYPGTTVLDHATPGAYCLPGRHRQVVLTSAALASLGEEQLAAVLAHERAHLTGHHDLVLGGADALRRAFPRVPLFYRGVEEVRRLVELVADDAAARRQGRRPVAEAMVALAGAGAPPAALAAGGAGALERVRRLVAPARPLTLKARIAGFALAFGLVVAPALGAVLPALLASRSGSCPMSGNSARMSMSTPCRHSPRLREASSGPTRVASR